MTKWGIFMKTTAGNLQIAGGSVQSVEEREQDIWKKVCEQLTDITSGMSEEEKQDYEKKIRAKLQRGANLSVEELNYLRIHNPELYRSAMRVKTAKQQLKEQLRHCKSKQEANTLIGRAISRISDKDPDKTYMTAGLREVAEEFKKSFQYARLPETNDQKRAKKAKKACGKKKQDKKSFDMFDSLLPVLTLEPLLSESFQNFIGVQN